jgi:5-methylcytosine-specific restriction endonuclease McrA
MIATLSANDSVTRSSPTSAMQSSVLALNRAYAPVHVVDVKRAFTLLYKGQAEVVHVEDGQYLTFNFESWLELSEAKTALEDVCEWDDWIRTVTFAIQVPRVIRLLDYDRVPRNVVKFNRRNVFLRDENRCQYCTKKFGTHHLSLDHVIPRSRGGPSTWDNIVCACLRCNVRKGGRTPQEAGMKLFKAPSKPHRNPSLAHQLSSQKYSAWKNFLD